MSGLDEVVAGAAIVVCTGTGGVGKTTVTAAVGLEAARRGRRTVVVTIDPAKRLADAMGIGDLTDTPRRIDGPGPGELWATMLDTKSTFDAVVRKYAADAEQVDRILSNRFYRNISVTLSGTQEYMAMEKLYELHHESEFDLVVVDTPPTRHALDFIDAPRRLTRFLDHRLYRLLMAPTRGIVRAVNVAAQAFLRTVSKVVGGEVIEDAIGFFQAFHGMEEGVRQRAEAVVELLSADETAFVLVASPHRDTVSEASFFAVRLREAGIAVRALVVNRMHPRFGSDPGGGSQPELELDESLVDSLDGSPLGDHYRNLAEFRLVAAKEADHLEQLRALVAPAPTVRVPFLPSDVHDLDGLAALGRYLFTRPD
ncbi:MAG: ArsA family ATPase [Acidimicrobiales bacterium]